MTSTIIRRRARLSAGFAAQAAAATPHRRARDRRNAVVSRSRAGFRQSIHCSAREDSFRADRMGRVRAGSPSRMPKPWRRTGSAGRPRCTPRSTGIVAFGRRARHGVAGHPRQGVPRAGLSRAGRADAPQGPRIHRFARRLRFSAVGDRRAEAGLAQPGQGLSEPGAGTHQTTARGSRLRADARTDR